MFLDIQLSVGLKPRAPGMNSKAFSFNKVSFYFFVDGLGYKSTVYSESLKLSTKIRKTFCNVEVILQSFSLIIGHMIKNFFYELGDIYIFVLLAVIYWCKIWKN